MSILFIDTGWKDLGLASFADDGKFISSLSLSFTDRHTSHDRILCIISTCETITDFNTIKRVVYERYTVRDDSTGKSKKGQKTLFCNGLISGFFYGRALCDEVDHNHWKGVYSRYRLDRELKGLPALTPPKDANDHAPDAFKMGVAWFVEKGIIK